MFSVLTTIHTHYAFTSKIVCTQVFSQHTGPYQSLLVFTVPYSYGPYWALLGIIFYSHMSELTDIMTYDKQKLVEYKYKQYKHTFMYYVCIWNISNYKLYILSILKN